MRKEDIHMIIKFNKDNYLEKYTPHLWECLGFKFRNEDLIYKLNCFNKRHNPMFKVPDDENCIYHLIYDYKNVTSLILKVSNDRDTKIIKELQPVSYSTGIPKYNAELINKSDNKYIFSFFDNKNNNFLLSSEVELSLFQRDLNKIDNKMQNIVVGKNYIISSYLLSLSVFTSNNKELFKEKLSSLKYHTISDFDIENKEFSSQAIAGRIMYIKNLINIFTGLRFYEIGFVCKQNMFVVYLPSYCFNIVPKIDDFICCLDYTMKGEIISIKDNTCYQPTSHTDIFKCKNDNYILNLKMDYLKGYENIVKIKNDEIFDGNVKISSLHLKIYDKKMTISADMYENNKDSVNVKVTQDKNFNDILKKLNKITFQPHYNDVEDLVDGVYWFVDYKGKYVEGHDETPEIIKNIKSIIEFDKIIKILHKTYIKYDNKIKN